MPRAKRRLCRSVAGAEPCPERTPLLEEGRGRQGGRRKRVGRHATCGSLSPDTLETKARSPCPDDLSAHISGVWGGSPKNSCGVWGGSPTNPSV